MPDILIVEDNPVNQKLIAFLLARSQYSYDIAENGAVALERLERSTYRLVLMDMMMPVMDGFEAIRRMRSMPATAQVPIIAASASTTPDTEARSRDAGASMCLSKPINHPALFDSIATLLNLTWIRAAFDPAASESGPVADADLVPPPPEEIAVLHALARTGNMRRISERADHVRSLDPRYAPFAARLRSLAEGCHSKAIMSLVQRFESEGSRK